MKTLNLCIDPSFIKNDEERSKFKPKENWKMNIEGALSLSGGREGISKKDQRILFKIWDKIDAADEVNPSIDLEDAEFDMIYDAFEKAKFPAGMCRLLNQVYDKLELAKSKKEG